MNHNDSADSVHSARPRLVAVRFEFAHPKAVAVSVAGSFNDWHPTAKTMHPAGGGYWLKDTVLPPGTYEYCLVVDGQWLPDPCVPETVPNPFGGRNSVLKVAG